MLKFIVYFLLALMSGKRKRATANTTKAIQIPEMAMLMVHSKPNQSNEVKDCDSEALLIPASISSPNEVEADMLAQPLLFSTNNHQHLEPEAFSSAATLDAEPFPESPTASPCRIPATFEPVADWQPDDIRSIFQDLVREPCPELQSLNLCNDRMWDGHSLACLQSAFRAFGLDSNLLGERQNILHFEHALLATGLRITGRNRAPNLYDGESWVQIPDMEDGCRLVWTHTDFETREWRIYKRQSIVDVLLYVLNVWRMLEKGLVSGRLRPVPMDDEQLLGILKSGDWIQCARFAEAKRAVERQCLLDAVVELCTPFALRPKEMDRTSVVFENSEVSNLVVTRFDGYVDWTDPWAPKALLESGIFLQCTTSASPKQRALDDERRPLVMLEGTTLNDRQRKRLPKAGMFYNLSAEDEVVALVRRILLYRDENQARCREESKPAEVQLEDGERPKDDEQERADGEQETVERPTAKRKRQERSCVGRGSPLRYCVDLEDVVSDAPREHMSEGSDSDDDEWTDE